MNEGRGDADARCVAAGIRGETHGLLGSLPVAPEPATLALVAAGARVLVAGAVRRRRTLPAGRSGPAAGRADGARAGGPEYLRGRCRPPP